MNFRIENCILSCLKKAVEHGESDSWLSALTRTFGLLFCTFQLYIVIFSKYIEQYP